MEKKSIDIRVMIVEDEPVVCWEMRERLTRMGCRVLAAVPTGEKALEIAEQERPDLIFMDIVLEGDLNGIETARAVKKIMPEAQVVYCTSFTGEVMESAMRTMPRAYLNKPVDYGKIEELIRGL